VFFAQKCITIIYIFFIFLNLFLISVYYKDTKTKKNNFKPKNMNYGHPLFGLQSQTGAKVEVGWLIQPT